MKVFALPSDFACDYSHNKWILLFKENDRRVEIHGYKSLKECHEAIEKLSNPQKVTRPVYSGECECINKQWIYYEEDQEGLVFKVCTVCHKPLDVEIVNHFAKDFDLDKFIAGE